LAELLRLEPGRYHVPNGPALLAGVDLELLPGLHAHLTGLMIPDLAAPDQSPVFLYGSVGQTVTLGGFTLALDGQCWMVQGEWPAHPQPQGVSFDGKLTFDCGATRLVDAHGLAWFRRKGEDYVLTVTLQWDFNWEVKLGDLLALGSPLAVGKLWTCDDQGEDGPATVTLELTLTTSPTGVAIKASANGDLGLRYCVMVPKLVERTIVVAPATRVQVWVPPVPFGAAGDWRSVYLPEVTIQIWVPDPEQLVPVHVPPGKLVVDLANLGVALSATAPPSITLDLDVEGVTWPLSLPSFLPSE
jgi:hypothetical protein